MSQASVSLAINSVTNALEKRGSEFIAFPINQQTHISHFFDSLVGASY